MLKFSITLKPFPFVFRCFILFVLSMMMPVYLSSFNNNTTYGQVQTEETGKAVENDVKELVSSDNSLYDIRNYTGVIEYYDKALAINPNDTNALNGKGLTLDQLGKYKEAIAYFNKALAINPNDTNALYNKALALSNLGRDAEAIQFYDKILAINPNDIDALYNKDLTLDRLGI
jgi:tetratricopeptide (TPR) repeat protein